MSESKHDETNRFWTEQALNQFGMTSNFFFIISAGVFAYLIEKHDPKQVFYININTSISVKNCFLFISLLFAFFSLIASALVVLSRLHDLRLTRHTVWIRKKARQSHNYDFKDDHIDLEQHKRCALWENFWTTIRRRHYFINDKELADENIREQKFNALRLRNLLLGRFSWNMVNWQFLFLGVSVTAYIISIFL